MTLSLLMYETCVLPAFADAAATAAPDGAWISTAAISALCAGIGAVLGKFWPSRVRAEVKRPMDTDDTFVTVGQCKQHRCALQREIDNEREFARQVLNRLDEMDTKAEKRSVDLHRRLDPVVEKVAQCSAEVGMLKELKK